ncbi:MAG: CvpA family protein [Candidatus Berkelbacteria bacterium]
MNWIDGVLILVFSYYVLEDSRRGFLRVVADFIGLVLAFSIALFAYIPFASFVSVNFNLDYEAAKPLSFLILWIGSQLIFFIFSKIISYYTPAQIKESKTNRYLAVLPAMFKGVFFVIMLIILVLAAPISADQKKLIQKSAIVNLTLKYASNLEGSLEKVFNNSSTKLSDLKTVSNDTNTESMALNFLTNSMNIDENAEKIILAKINTERQKMGLNPLISDVLIRNVARIHSRDMLARGYFSHTGKDGETLFDRLVRAKVDFQEAAENLALASSPEAVHAGLMNSPKHKQNILNPSFTRVGIGVMNAGKYGLMVTQDFAN